MTDKTQYRRILALLGQEVKPALGCTEPIAVALAAARAAAVFPDSDIDMVSVRVSPNILKNAMGVGIPGTSLTGLPSAVALALACGNHEWGLEVLRNVNERAVSTALKMVAEGRIDVDVSDSPKILYAEVECRFRDGHVSLAVVQDSHDNIALVSSDGKVLEDRRNAGEDGNPAEDNGKFLTLSMIYDFAKSAALEDLSLMREEVRMNMALAEEGMKGSYGLNVGKTIAAGSHRDVFGESFVSYAMELTASASDARMAGCSLPAMSNSGSGNQGITVSLPVIAAARIMHSSEEELLRALALSNLVAIHIKSYLGKLSALCGCVIASTGSSCGLIMLKGGTVEQMGAAIKNMIGSITGMVCDGAKAGCAMKVASGVSCAIQSALLAMDGICVQPTDGIIDTDVEKTIRNIGEIGSRGMCQTDRLILEIMTRK